MYYEEVVRLFPEPKTVSNWVMGDLLRELKRDEREIDQCPVTPLHLAEMLSMIKDGTISGKIAKDVFEEMSRTGAPPPRSFGRRDGFRFWTRERLRKRSKGPFKGILNWWTITGRERRNSLAFLWER